MRVVIDCNIIVSAAITDGTCRLAVAEALANHEIVISEEILSEYRGVAGRRKFSAHTRSRMNALIDEIGARAKVVAVPAIDLSAGAQDVLIVDPKDEPYVMIAALAQADAIITGNSLDFVEPAYGGALVVTARAFLEMTDG